MSELRQIPGFDYALTADGRVWSFPKAPVPGRQGRKHGGMWVSPVKHPWGPIVRMRRDGVLHQRSLAKLLRDIWPESVPSLSARSHAQALVGGASPSVSPKATGAGGLFNHQEITC